MSRKSSYILPLHREPTFNSDSQGSRVGLLNQGKSNGRWKNDLLAGLAEFVGTFMFLFFSFGGTQLANSSSDAVNVDNSVAPLANTSVLLYIALSFGFSLMVNVWVFYRISGGLFNPSVTLGLFLVGAVPWTRAIIFFVAQMLGGMAAAGVVSAMFPGPLDVSTVLSAGMSKAQGLFLEMFLTTLLVFTIFMLAVEKHKATHIAPIGIGLAFFLAELVGLFYTGGSLNPARSFGPCVVTHSFPGYHYIYWIGPFMGTLLATGFYKLFQVMNYQTINPGQDFDDHETALFQMAEGPVSVEQVARPNVAAMAGNEIMQELGKFQVSEKCPSNGAGIGSSPLGQHIDTAAP
ncbi:aquaporin-5 [Pyrenochaeta sp. DS3sAY3a]|nr:aquaporin-5 [Pyrenochaeta sp. DS3sAY3a]